MLKLQGFCGLINVVNMRFWHESFWVQYTFWRKYKRNFLIRITLPLFL